MIIEGDCIRVMAKMKPNSIDGVVTDPPYGLAFMGKKWDGFKTPEEFYRFNYLWGYMLYRVLKPGAFGCVFGGTRTFHRTVCALEDVGFEIRDVLMWLYACLSNDTEILTLNGWKKRTEITENDIVFSYDCEKEKIVKSKIDWIFENYYYGKMINLINKDTDQLITPNHRVLCKTFFRKQINKIRKYVTNDEGFTYIDASLIKTGNKYILPLSSNYDGKISIGGKLFAELLGWILTDGWFHNNCSSISISQVKKKGVRRIRHLLKKLNISYSEYKRKKSTEYRKDYIEHQFYIKSSRNTRFIRKIIPNKKPNDLLLNLTLDEKFGLFDGLMGGDGSKNTFWQSDIKTLEWFQLLCHFIGKQGKINIKKLCVSIKNQSTTELQAKHLSKRFKHYQGIVWCIKTTIGNFFARRNGKIFITGNSGFPKGPQLHQVIDKHLGLEPKLGRMKVSPDGIPYNKRQIEGHPMTTDEVYGKTVVDKDKWYEKIPNSPKARRWNGFRTGLKPAWEPIILIQKPREGTYPENILKWHVGGLNIDGCRIPINIENEDDPRAKDEEKNFVRTTGNSDGGSTKFFEKSKIDGGYEQQLYDLKGRYPTNVVVDEWVYYLLEGIKNTKKGKVVRNKDVNRSPRNEGVWKNSGYFQTTSLNPDAISNYNDGGGLGKFFYCPKAARSERDLGLKDFKKKRSDTTRNKPINNPFNRNVPKKNHHPTVKPLKLMTYLVRLIKPPYEGATIIDPFGGTGSTLIACKIENANCVYIERESSYVKIARRRDEIPLIMFSKYTDSVIPPQKVDGHTELDL